MKVFSRSCKSLSNIYGYARYRFSIYESKNFAEEAPDFSAGKYVGWEIS